MADHGLYDGLLDDDHQQYLPANGNRPMLGGLDIDTTDGALLIPILTTTQRDALTPVDGMMIYNVTLGKHQRRQGGAWVHDPDPGESFVTIGNPSGLSAERALTSSSSVLVTDGGAGGTVEIAVDEVDGGFY